MPEELETEYQSLTTGAGFVRLKERTVVSMRGNDRHRLLHSFCTADIKKLDLDQSTEAFVLNDKGKILWHGHVLSLADGLLLTSAGAYATALISHLDKYIIRDDVQLSDQSASLDSFFLRGEKTASQLKKTTSQLPEPGQVFHCEGEIPFIVANVEIAGSGFLLLVDHLRSKEFLQQLTSAKIVQCHESTLEIVRIEHRTPWLGKDMDESNLPQELQRDAKAISFTKGCYLGQETVARIDAIGHVNQWLVGLRIQFPSKPEPGAPLFYENKPVGRVTSVAQTIGGQTIGLGYVRRAKAISGMELELDGGTAVVEGDAAPAS